MKPRKTIRYLPALIVGTGVALAVGPVSAEDLFRGVGAVSGQSLAAERGMAFELDEKALATAIGAQHQTVTINGAEIPSMPPGGEMDFGSHTFFGQVMSVNVMNTGHQNAFQVQNVVAVTVINGVPQ